MNETDFADHSDWQALLSMTEDEARTNAMSDPENQPSQGYKPLNMPHEEGKTLLQRFRKALAREKKVSLTVRYDADIVSWYKAKGKGYQTAMNAALRAYMEAEQAEMAAH